MIININGNSEKLIIQSYFDLLDNGFVLIKAWSQRKYILFGETIYYIRMKKTIIKELQPSILPFAVGGFGPKGEYVIPVKPVKPDVRFAVDTRKAGENLRRILKVLEKETCSPTKNKKEYSKDQLTELLNAALDNENYEYAAQIRDRLKKL